MSPAKRPQFTRQRGKCPREATASAVRIQNHTSKCIASGAPGACSPACHRRRSLARPQPGAPATPSPRRGTAQACTARPCGQDEHAQSFRQPLERIVGGSGSTHLALNPSKVSSRKDRSRSTEAPPARATASVVAQKTRVSRSLLHNARVTQVSRAGGLSRCRSAPDEHPVHAQPVAHEHIPAGGHHPDLGHWASGQCSGQQDALAMCTFAVSDMVPLSSSSLS